MADRGSLDASGRPSLEDAESAVSSPGLGASLRLLLVEDSETDCILLLREFKRGGFDVQHCRVENEAALKQALQRNWDLVITDYQLPGFDGLQAVAQVQEHDPDLPVIMVSGRIGEETAVNVMRAGVRDYVMKDNLHRLIPVARRELEEAAQRVARRKAEEALRISEQRFSEFAENVEDVFWLASPDWKQSYYVSPAFYSIWGVSPSEDPAARLPRPWRDAVHPHDLPTIEASIRRACIDDDFVMDALEYRIIRPNGQVRWIKSRTYPVRGKDGRIQRIAGTAQDITTRHNAEKSSARNNCALRALNACNKALARDTDESTFVADVCRIIVEVSGYSAAWVDYVEPEDVAARQRVALFGEQGVVDFNDCAGRITTEIGAAAIEAVLRDRAASQFCNLSVCGSLQTYSALLLPLIIDDEPRGVLTIVSSVAAFDGMEVPMLEDLSNDLAFGISILRERGEKEHLQSQLVQARKMEAIGQLSGGIAHDFNNMLSSILGYAGLALERTDELPKESLDEYLREVIRAGERARDLVGQMLSFSRTRKDTTVRAELQPIVRDLGNMLRFTLPASIELKIDTDDEALAVNVDAVQLQQILMNLSINARDAMHNKGTLAITARRIRIGENDTRLKCRSCGEAVTPGEMIELSVQDSGDGVVEEMLDRVFDPFFTTKDVGKGTGLGLSVVHGIVHEAGGHILLESEPGKGTTFRLLLPPADTMSADEGNETTQSPVPQAVSGTARIMVVDDEPSVAGFLKELLTVSGYEVLVAGDGEEALGLFRRQPGQIDLVITDQTMPKMTGGELAAALLALSPDLPIILCTGYSEDVNEASASEIGIKGYMHKPVASRKLLASIKQLLATGQA